MEKEMFAAARNKLQALCDENMLTFSFSEEYPITLTVRPQQGLDNQLTMLEMADDVPFNSPNATIVFKMEDGALTYYLSERFIISDALFSKIKGLFVKMHFAYLQAFHRDVVTQMLISKMPDIGSALSTDKIVEPLEEYTEELDEVTEGADLPNNLLEEDAPSTGDISFDVYLMNAAAEYAREQGGVSLDSIKSKFMLTFAKAAYVIDELVAAGIIGDVTDAGGFRKYIEEDAENG